MSSATPLARCAHQLVDLRLGQILAGSDRCVRPPSRRGMPRHRRNCSNFGVWDWIAHGGSTAGNLKRRAPTVPFSALFGTVSNREVISAFDHEHLQCRWSQLLSERCLNQVASFGDGLSAEDLMDRGRRKCAWSQAEYSGHLGQRLETSHAQTLRLTKLLLVDFRIEGPGEVHRCHGLAWPGSPFGMRLGPQCTNAQQ